MINEYIQWVFIIVLALEISRIYRFYRLEKRQPRNNQETIKSIIRELKK